MLTFTLSLRRRYNGLRFPNILNHTFFSWDVPYRTCVPRVSPSLSHISWFKSSPAYSHSLLTAHLGFWDRFLNWSSCFPTLLPHSPRYHFTLLQRNCQCSAVNCLVGQLSPSEPCSAGCFLLIRLSALPAPRPRKLYSFILFPVPGQILMLLQTQAHILPFPWTLSWPLCSRKRQAIRRTARCMSLHPSNINTKSWHLISVPISLSVKMGMIPIL